MWLRYLSGKRFRGKILVIRRLSMGINSRRHFREVIRIDFITKTFLTHTCRYLEREIYIKIYVKNIRTFSMLLVLSPVFDIHLRGDLICGRWV